ncbi:histidine kinase dimerization/phosphoacceptor domain -containing protein [Leptospira sp. 96542]|nr:histidine kinase dimerization/phosphoacceptor domain -containing protein [Leptospira sp. 96542]
MKPAIRVTLIYLSLGYLWIYFSDFALVFFMQSSEEVRQIQSLKGWLFVSFSGVIIFFLLFRELKRQKVVILEKNESDILYKTILERIEDAVIIFNIETWIIDFLSAQFCELFEYDSETIISKPEVLIERVHPEDRDRMSQIWIHGLTENHTGLMYRILFPDGRIKWALEHRLFIPASSGKTKKTVAVISDITSYMENQTKLEKSIKENQTLLTEVHHRVKNNLAVIISFLQLQAYSAPKETADILEQSIVRIKAIALVHEKLYSSKNLSSLSSLDYISSLVENIKLMYMRMDVSIELEIQHIEFNLVNAIPMGLMITEMLTNSFRHAFINQTEAKIKIKFIVYPSGNTELIYRDNGRGFPEGFDRKKSESIGLSVIYSLCSQMKGREKDFFSEPNRGVMYHFEFIQKK